MNKLDKLVVMAMICVLSMGFLVSITSVVIAADLDSGWVTETHGSIPFISSASVRVAGHTIQSSGQTLDLLQLLQGYSGVTVFDSGALEYKSFPALFYTCTHTRGVLSVIYYQGGSWYTVYDHTDNGPVNDKLITRDFYPPGAIMLKGECIADFVGPLGSDAFTLHPIAYLSTPTNP